MTEDTYSQNMAIRKDLLIGKVITQLDAIKDYHCTRLSARIWDLRHKYGLPIRTKKMESLRFLPFPRGGIRKSTFAGYYIGHEDREKIISEMLERGEKL